MVIDMLGNTLETKYTDSVSIGLPMAIATRVPGMKVVSKVMVCTLFEMVTLDAVDGTLETLRLH